MTTYGWWWISSPLPTIFTGNFVVGKLLLKIFSKIWPAQNCRNLGSVKADLKILLKNFLVGRPRKFWVGKNSDLNFWPLPTPKILNFRNFSKIFRKNFLKILAGLKMGSVKADSSERSVSSYLRTWRRPTVADLVDRRPWGSAQSGPTHRRPQSYDASRQPLIQGLKTERVWLETPI